MNFIFNYFWFIPSLILIFHCLFIFLFKKWLGSLGSFYSSLFVFFLLTIISIEKLYWVLTYGFHFYIDFGRWFLCLDFIDSHLVFCIDSLGLVCSILVYILTSLALNFGIEYMYREIFLNRLLYLLILFATSVVFLFFCYDFFLIIFSWECIGLFSFLLVNFYSVRVYTIKAAIKTFVFSRLSDMFMFLSFILAILYFNTTDLALIFTQTPFFLFHYLFFNQISIHFLTFFSFTIALSGVIKAAQFFSHVWLPDAMEAPTPASALIHSSTLVIAGIFLIIRFSLIFEFTSYTNYFLALLGSLTLCFGAIAAIFQNDIKKLVAYSTISQIGYLVCGSGFGCYDEVLLYLIIHALNKAFLFILVGYVVYYFNHNTDMRQMGGINLYVFDLTILLGGVCFNLAGLPYSASYIGKELLVFQLLKDDAISLIIRSCWLISFFFTPIYTFLLIFAVFFNFKKSVINSYLIFWIAKFKTNLQLITNVEIFNKKNYSIFLFNNFKSQFTILTCRFTTIILSIFWIFFYFFGEFLISLLLEYSFIKEIIIKNFSLNWGDFSYYYGEIHSSRLRIVFIFYICFLILNSIIFLLTIGYFFSYNHFLITLLSDLLLFVIFFNNNIFTSLLGFFFFYKFLVAR